MNNLKICIILLFFILFVSFLSSFIVTYIESMDDSVITIDQLAKLNNILINPTNEESDSIIKYITGLRLNNPYFTNILNDKYLTNYGKCIFLKEITDFVISNSVTQNDSVQKSFKQVVISNDNENFKDNITIEIATLINDILNGTNPDNADESIEIIDEIDLEGTLIQSILDIYELSSYNKVLIIRQMIDSMVSYSNVHRDKMIDTWDQTLSVSTTAPYVSTTAPYVSTTAP